MSTLDGYFLNDHVTQFDGSTYQGANCTPTSGANLAAAVSAGMIDKSGADIRRLVPRGQESNPQTPGWSIPDLDLALGRLGVGFDNRSGQGWSAVTAAHAKGLYLAVQGDSDRFGNNTCSGKFDGGHCIGVHPATRGSGAGADWWINDPICKTGRWERASVIRSYAEKLNPRIQFGVGTTPVLSVPDTSTATHTAHFRPFAVVRMYRLASRTGVDCIASWDDERWGANRSSARCQAPVHRDTCDGKSGAYTVLIVSGRYQGRHIRVGSGITVTED